jgi:hypothetical protein
MHRGREEKGQQRNHRVLRARVRRSRGQSDCGWTGSGVAATNGGSLGIGGLKATTSRPLRQAFEASEHRQAVTRTDQSRLSPV